MPVTVGINDFLPADACAGDSGATVNGGRESDFNRGTVNRATPNGSSSGIIRQ